jgi:hypothetical protein
VRTTALSNMQYFPLVQAKLSERRQNYAGEIPIDFNEGAMLNQCQIPDQEIIMHVLPSYVRYIAGRYDRADRPIASIRVYRVTHNITMPVQFVGTGSSSGTDLMDPTTYKPYYQGQFNKEGELLDPSDPMLYWLVPIRKNPNARLEDFVGKTSRHLTLEDYKRLYQDFVYQHAGSHHMEAELAK